MHDFKITGLALAREGGTEARHPVLARFACTIGPLAFEGCALKLRPGGEILASLPGPKNSLCRILIVDPEFRRALSDAALVVFNALGGVVPPLDDDTE